MKERIRFAIYEWQQRGGTADQLADDIMDVVKPPSPEPEWTRDEIEAVSHVPHDVRLAARLDLVKHAKSGGPTK